MQHDVARAPHFLAGPQLPPRVGLRRHETSGEQDAEKQQHKRESLPMQPERGDVEGRRHWGDISSKNRTAENAFNPFVSDCLRTRCATTVITHTESVRSANILLTQGGQMNLKATRLTLSAAALFLSVSLPAAAQTQAPRPQHTILLVIDGLSYLAPERVDMPNLKALMARGAYFRESYSVVPQHPHSGEWAENYDSSIPNPILVSGTIFLKPK